MTRKEFEQLEPDQQWLWVVNNKEEILLIELDNDVTYVTAARFKEDGNDECRGSISMKSYLGNGWGIDHLLEALGITVEGV